MTEVPAGEGCCGRWGATPEGAAQDALGLAPSSLARRTPGLAALREGPEHCQWCPLLSCDNLACLQTVTNVTERPAEDTSPPFENPRQTNMEL